jgi:uncharacterized protein YqgC (DUF456 family)
MEPFFTTIILGFGLLMAVFGIVACFLPILPGPPISFLSLVLLSWVKDWKAFSPTLLVVLAGATVLVLILDTVVPAAGAKKFGASRLGFWGSMIGMLLGLVFFPPFGLFVGAFVGAMAGELFAGKTGDDALRAGAGVFVGVLVGIGLKMGLSGVMLFYYVKGIL